MKRFFALACSLFVVVAANAAKPGVLFDMEKDAKQYTNLADKPEFAPVVAEFKAKLAAKLRAVRDNDLGRK